MAHQVNLAGRFFLGKLEYADMIAREREALGQPVSTVVIHERRANIGGFSAEAWEKKIGDEAELKYGYPPRKNTPGSASSSHIRGRVVSVAAQTIQEAAQEFTQEERWRLAGGTAAADVAAQSQQAVGAIGAKAAQDEDQKITRIGIELPISDVRAILAAVRTRYQQTAKDPT